MNLLFLVAKVLIVVFFLIMFIRSSKTIWGVGLITVTSAILLDTFLGTFGREEMLEQLGFFFYIAAGALFAGGAIWLWGIVRPIAARDEPAANPASSASVPVQAAPTMHQPSTAIDRQMLFDTINDDFGQEDILDLIFDLGYSENQVLSFHDNTQAVITRVIDLAEENGQQDELALAVERILKPLPADHLPRLEKISYESPQTVVRQFMIANYRLSKLESLSSGLGIDWEDISGDNKRSKVRNLLLYAKRRHRSDELIDALHQLGANSES